MGFLSRLIYFHPDNDMDRKTNFAPPHLNSVYLCVRKQNIMSHSKTNDLCGDELEKYNL